MLADTYLVFLRKGVMRWLLQADRLQASSALPACSAADPVAFSTVWSAFPALWGQPALVRDSSSLSGQNPTFKEDFLPSVCREASGASWPHQALGFL